MLPAMSKKLQYQLSSHLLIRGEFDQIKFLLSTCSEIRTREKVQPESNNQCKGFLYVNCVKHQTPLGKTIV